MPARLYVRSKPAYEGHHLDHSGMYVIKWKSKITGLEGQSNKAMPKKVAQEVAMRMNKRWPSIDRWIEKA